MNYELKKAPRGIRNCNPLNIRKNAANRWKGEIRPGSDPEFCQFETMEMGVRAAFIILRNYMRVHRLRTPTKIIRRWAPPNENQTEQYIKSVCRMTGFLPNQILQETDLPLLLRAMAQVECGMTI